MTRQVVVEIRGNPKHPGGSKRFYPGQLAGIESFLCLRRLRGNLLVQAGVVVSEP